MTELRDREEQLECACGWRGKRRDLLLHPRQGYGVCPRCWRNGIERIPRATCCPRFRWGDGAHDLDCPVDPPLTDREVR